MGTARLDHPGLLGTLTSFRDRYATAVEGDREDARRGPAAGPAGPAVPAAPAASPTPASRPNCRPRPRPTSRSPLTREQASLYEAVVRETMAEIEEAEGIARRGLVMKLLTALKQICNHPAQYLKETAGAELAGPLRQARTPRRTAGHRSSPRAGRSWSSPSTWRWGGCSSATSPTAASPPCSCTEAPRSSGARRWSTASSPARCRCSCSRSRPPGTGLNLTRAGHVIHYDRWWNPAVEDQATDRAYRIGQTQPVQVHRLIAEGTVEDRIAEMLAPSGRWPTRCSAPARRP